ncbi:MAG: hypothetical protein HY369_01060 [Candidatus Aenigmarchaeota archaeon]|nr:hypothetical protein [Candidatus Aenigmarchaeota archaeon]
MALVQFVDHEERRRGLRYLFRARFGTVALGNPTNPYYLMNDLALYDLDEQGIRYRHVEEAEVKKVLGERAQLLDGLMLQHAEDMFELPPPGYVELRIMVSEPYQTPLRRILEKKARIMHEYSLEEASPTREPHQIGKYLSVHMRKGDIAAFHRQLERSGIPDHDPNFRVLVRRDADRKQP